MKYKVKIKKLPTAQTGQQVNYGMYNPLATMGGKDGAKPQQTSVRKSIGGVAREEANLEAEGGETVMTDLVGMNIPQHYTITGPRHAQGGVPMSLPNGAFVFSDFNQMKLNDPDMLAKFGKTVKKQGKGKGFTPADLAKQYDINKYIKILQDPNSDAVDKKTAELMIKNYNIKLGALAIAQEAKKGFEDGVPEVSMPYMDHVGITERDLGVVPKEVQEIAEIITGLLKQGLDIVDVLSNLIRQDIPVEIISEALIEVGLSQEEIEQIINDTLTNLQDNKAPQQEQQMAQEVVENEEMMTPDMMTPEMMMCGGQPKRKLRRRQEGGMSPEAMQQGDPMGQIVGIIEQMFAQGMEAPEVVMELLQQGLAPEDILQVFVQMGMPEQEAAMVIEQALAQGQAPEGMDPTMQGQGMTPDMMPAMDPGMAMMQMGGEQDQLLQEIAQALQQGMQPEEVMQALVQQGVPQQEAQAIIQQVMQGMQAPANPAMYQRGGQLRKYQSEGEVTEPTTPKTKIPAKYKDNKRYHQGSKEFSVFGLKKGDYVKTGDKWQRITVDMPDEDPNVKGIIPNTGDALLFQRLQTVLNDPDVKAAFAEKYKEALGNKNYFTDKQGTVGRMWDKASSWKDLSPDDMVNAYLDHIKSNLVLKALNVTLTDFKDDGTVKTAFKDKYKDLVNSGETISIDNIKKKNVPGWEAESDYIAKGQAGQWALKDLIEAKNTFPPEIQAKLAPLNVPSLSGVADEKGTGLSQQFFSPIDGYDHNTSAGHLGTVSGYVEDVLEEEAQKPADPNKPADVAAAETFPLPTNPIYDWSPQAKRSAAFLAGAYFSRQKQYPWAAPEVAVYPNYALMDPTRAIAAASEQAAITAQGISNLGQSAGLASARLAQSQGQQATQAANIASQYDQQNVGIVNAFEQQYAALANQAQSRNRGMRKGLYDDTMRMLDQYRKEGLGIKEKIVENANVADASAAKRYNLSTLTQDFDVLPDGRVVFTGQEKASTPISNKSFDEYIAYYKPMFKNDEDVIRAAKIQYEIDNKSSANDSNPYELLDRLQQGGMVLGSHVFPFMFY